MNFQDHRVKGFSDALDDLIFMWREKHLDDRPTYAEMVGALMFRAHNLMTEAQREGQEGE